MSAALRVGVFGAGIVGGGVIDLVQRLTASGRLAMVGATVEIVAVCVQSADKQRDIAVNGGTKVVTNFDDILGDASINCVVEVMGGVTAARDVVLGAINSGKHVITANKALIAAYMAEIQAALAANPSVRFLFEAAVCGGIPVIHTLQSGFLGDRVTKIAGIMNGTTNFMLCKMEDEGADYSAVLREAQRLGFAEADPTADVEGLDVQAKVAVLAKLTFGRSVPAAQVPTVGISSISAVDFAYAKSMSCTIKLLGTAVLNASNGSLAVFVSPTLVACSNPLATAKGPGNMVLITSDNMGQSTLAGPGAGRYATANSVLSDLIRLSQGAAPVQPFPLEAADMAVDSDYRARFYIRVKAVDSVGIIRAVGAAAEANTLSIHTILQNPTDDPDNIYFVVTTDEAALSQVQGFVGALKGAPFSGTPLFMPIL